ncbi:MAG: Cof-type HAD-IIB family hydrolase [Desulfocucumaceae bacterium]
MRDIKLIAVDLDDTLLRNDLTISTRTKRAIAQAIESGASVTFATGRMFASALPFARELNLDLPLICYQGALVKYVDGRVVYHKPMALELARRVIDFLLPYKYHINLYIDDELRMERESPEGRRYAGISKVPVHFFERLHDALSAEPTKILIIAKEQELDHLSGELEKSFAPQVNIMKSKPYFLEVADSGATKGKALADLARSLELDADQVMAIGDSWNDLDMLQYAGVAVAMENAMPEVKAIAGHITSSNDADGVAEAIEKYVLARRI